MKIKAILVTLFLCATQTLLSQNYKIDAGHSNIQIEVQRFGVVDVSGRFNDVEGTITFNSEAPEKTNANAVIQVKSYDANNKGGEDAVKSPAFLDVAKFPTITFQGVKSITQNGKNYLKGNLTIHGVTNEVMLPYEINGPHMDLPTQKQSIAFNGAITINRQDYGINFDRGLPNGIKLVANEVKIRLNVLAIADE